MFTHALNKIRFLWLFTHEDINTKIFCIIFPTIFNVRRNLVRATFVADSLAQHSRTKGAYIQNLKNILEDREAAIAGTEEGIDNPKDERSSEKYQNIKLSRSPEDSLLRVQIESEDGYNLNYMKLGESGRGGGSTVRRY